MKKLLGLIALTMMSACGFEVVDTGYRGVQTRFGEVVSESLPEGLHFYNPFTSDIIELDTRIQRFETKTHTYTKDIQQANITVIVNYALDKTLVHKAYQEYGYDVAERVFSQAIEGSLKSVVGTWDAVDLISNREKARETVENNLRETVKSKYLLVERLELINIDYNDEFERAVEAKVTAVQRAAEATNKTKQIEEEAKQQVIAAKAEAESMRIRAEALRQNKGLTEYEAVQKWNGELPTMMFGGGSVPFINLNNLK